MTFFMSVKVVCDNSDNFNIWEFFVNEIPYEQCKILHGSSFRDLRHSFFLHLCRPPRICLLCRSGCIRNHISRDSRVS